MFIVIDCIDLYRILFFLFFLTSVACARRDVFLQRRFSHCPPLLFPSSPSTPSPPFPPPRPIFTHDKLIEVYRRTYRFAYQPKCITKFDIDYNNNSTLLQHSLTRSFIHHHPFKYSLQAISLRELLWNYFAQSKIWIGYSVVCFLINMDFSHELIKIKYKRWRIFPSRDTRFSKPYIERNSNLR